MDDELKFIAKIQRYYDVLSFKKIDIEDRAMCVQNGERKFLLDKINILSELILEYDNIFKEFLYKDRS